MSKLDRCVPSETLRERKFHKSVFSRQKLVPGTLYQTFGTLYFRGKMDRKNNNGSIRSV